MPIHVVFFWIDDPHSKDPPTTLQMLVHVFGAKDSATCAIYAVRRPTRDNYREFDALTYETLLNAFYVDDLLKAVGDADTAIKLIQELIKICRQGGFRLTKFFSNFHIKTLSI